MSFHVSTYLPSSRFWSIISIPAFSGNTLHPNAWKKMDVLMFKGVALGRWGGGILNWLHWCMVILKRKKNLQWILQRNNTYFLRLRFMQDCITDLWLNIPIQFWSVEFLAPKWMFLGEYLVKDKRDGERIGRQFFFDNLHNFPGSKNKLTTEKWTEAIREKSKIPDN